MPRKLGMTATQRQSVLKNQATKLLWYGRIETTETRAKELRSYVEKVITLAINSYEDTIETTVSTTDAKGKEVTKTVIKDGAKKLAARRRIMSKLHTFTVTKEAKESKAAVKERTKGINHPIIEKIFNEIAPKYAQRAEELGQGGGYTRIYSLGERRGDAAKMAIIELV
ncbi:MAG: 50S ribosomal protein L17 [Clostridia bacterium]|nr:50S ribosomal protein L17 [Clostridia bacterium]